MYTAWTDVVLAVTLALQLILSVLYQFRSMASSNLGRVARILALPSWCFFAPRPGTTDYRLLSRCESVADVGYWNELDIGWRGRYVRRALWNPRRSLTRRLPIVCRSSSPPLLRCLRSMSDCFMSREHI